MPGFAPLLVILALGQADAAPPSVQAEPQAAERQAPTPTPTPTPTSTPSPTPTRTSSPTSSATPKLPAPARSRQDPAAERAEAERAARSFLEALAGRNADALAAACADRFSFDGDVVTGREPVRAAWRAVLGGRAGAAPRVGALEVLAAQEAIARHGAPPPRVAALARPGAFVAVADVGGRSVVLFVAREAGRMAVLGMHD
jgi:hypothetical protein